MKIAQLQKKSKSELEKLLKERREQLRKLRFALASEKLKNYREIRKTKRDIARILTILNRLNKAD